MCANCVTVSRKILFDIFDAPIHSADDDWRDEAYQDCLALIICCGADGGIGTDTGIGGGRAGPREFLVASYGMVPKAHIPPGVKRFSTMNARAETVGQLRSFAPSWRAGQLCLIPMHAFFEPNWETDSAVRWKIGMADESPFAAAGVWCDRLETNVRSIKW